METPSIPEADPINPQPPRPGIISMIIKVFAEPSGLFGALTRKTDWLIPFVIAIILGGIAGHFITPIRARDQKESIVKQVEKQTENLPAEQKAQIQQRLDDQFADQIAGKFEWYYIPLVIGAGFVFLAIISGIGMAAGNFAFGGKAGFWIVMNVIAWAGLIGLCGDLLRSILIYTKDSMDVYTGLGLLQGMLGRDSLLFYLLRQIDIFTIWRIVVTAIGLGVIYKMSTKKFAYVLFGIWFVFILLVAVLNKYIAAGMIVY